MSFFKTFNRPLCLNFYSKHLISIWACLHQRM